MRHTRIVSRYITVDFALACIVTFLVLTFVSSLSFIFRMADMIGMGAPVLPLLQLFVYGMPTVLVVSIPLSVLVAGLLVFRRLSSDGEVTAMRACGISVAEIVSGPLIFAGLLSAVCLYSNHELEPRAHLARRNLTSQIRNLALSTVIEPGRFMNRIPGISIYVGERQGDMLLDVRISDSREDGFRRSISAERASLVETDTGGLQLELYEASITPLTPDSPETATVGRWILDLSEFWRQGEYRPGPGNLAFLELMEALRAPAASFEGLDREGYARLRSELLYEMSSRTAMAAAAFAVALIGIPMGIVSRRRDSNAGITASLVLYILFSVLNAGIDNVSRMPELRAWLLVWVPPLLLGVTGLAMMWRVNRV